MANASREPHPTPPPPSSPQSPSSQQTSDDDQRDSATADDLNQLENEETIHERLFLRRHQSPGHQHRHRTISSRSLSSRGLRSSESVGSIVTREHVQYGASIRPERVEVLYRRDPPPPPALSENSTDRHLKEEQAKQVAPNMHQSPVSLMTINPAYEPQNRPITLEYPATIENLRISNTGFSWEVKIPYQISITTALRCDHMPNRYRLDQFHCHWGDSELQGSEHVIDGVSYSAEMHFVHYNMERYHTLSKAARHPDGLVVVAVFLDAKPQHHNHAELDKIVNQLKWIPLKGDHAIVKQAIRVENLLPPNRSYWSYHGSLTTPPYLESVTWFVLKQPIKCSTSQLERFRSLKSNLRPDDEQVHIRSNFRRTQPLNGRTIISYDEPNGCPVKSPAAAGTNSSISSSTSSASNQASGGALGRQSGNNSHH